MSSQKNTSKRLLTSAVSFLLISTFLFISLVAFSGMNKSAAWFSSVKEVSAEGMSISVSAPETYEVDYFQITSISLSDGENNYHFDASAPSGNGKLQTYSALSGERQLLIKISELDLANAITLSAKSSSQTYPVYNGAEISKDTPLGLSSVVKIYILDSDSVDLVDGEYVVYSDDLTDDNAKTFASPNTGNNSANVPYLLDSDIELYSSSTGNSDSELYIFIDYYEESMDCVLNYVNNLMMTPGGTDYKSGDEVQFIGDFIIDISKAKQ